MNSKNSIWNHFFSWVKLNISYHKHILSNERCKDYAAFIWIFFRQWELIPSLGHMNNVVQTYKPIVRILVLGTDLKFPETENETDSRIYHYQSNSMIHRFLLLLYFIAYPLFNAMRKSTSKLRSSFLAVNQSFSKKKKKTDSWIHQYTTMMQRTGISSIPLWCNDHLLILSECLNILLGNSP